MNKVKRNILISLSLLTFFVSLCIAENPLTYYIIYRASFSQSNLDTFQTYGDKQAKQPGKRAELWTPNNTNYYLIGISTWTKSQQDVIELFESSGRIIKWKSIWNVDKMLSPQEAFSNIQIYNNPPSDMNKKWEVHPSS